MRIITGKVRGLKLTTPKNIDVRPTADRVKESLFNILAAHIAEKEVLDLFAGTGNLGLEAWSRGAKRIVFIDENRDSLKLVSSNIAKCKAEENTKVLKGNAVNIIETLFSKGEHFDIIFCDPPYNKGWVQKILDQLAVYPLLKHDGWLIVEHAKHEAIDKMPEGIVCVRQEVYGETLISFLKFA